MTIEQRRAGTAKARAALFAKWHDPIGILRRFWSKVKVTDLDECWPWIGTRDAGGYGRFRMNGKNRAAHRTAYQFTYGSIRDDMDCCHTCDNPSCCNPKHLKEWTTQKNIHDAIEKGRWRMPKGEEAARAKLTEKQVIEIFERSKLPGFVTEYVAKEYGVSGYAIYAIRTGKSWTHLKLGFQSSAVTI